MSRIPHHIDVSIDKADKAPMIVLTLAERKIGLPARDAHEIRAKLIGRAIEAEIQAHRLDHATHHPVGC